MQDLRTWVPHQATAAGRLPAGPGRALDRLALRLLSRTLAGVSVRFVTPSGLEAQFDPGQPVATVVVKDRRAWWGLLVDPQYRFAEDYSAGRIEVDGDLVAMLVSVYRAIARRTPVHRAVRVPARPNTVQRSRHNVHHHYDLGNDFYRLWLDPELLYTCAYFPAPTDTLEAAQTAKMDLVCRKLGLRPGEHVVEAGCGWGALALYMARHYGVTVKAYNLSREQIRYARARAAREGLADRVEFIQDDYRAIQGTFDKFVSVGMLEHVGTAQYPVLGALIDRVLPPGGGRGLLHFIGRNRPMPLNRWIRTRIFPGAYPPTIPEVATGVLEPWGFSMLDVENLRLHYAKTLVHWLARFDEAADQVASMFDPQFVRIWRMYLAGSQAAFLTGSMQLFQVVFARGTDNGIPWVRQGWNGARREPDRAL